MTGRRFGLMMVLAGALVAQATPYWWSGNGSTLGGSGTWDTSLTRWSSTPEGPFTFVAWPNGGGDEAVFTNAGGTVTLGATAIKVNTMKFIGSAQNWTFNSGTLDFGSNGSVVITNDDHVTINSGITGSGTLTLTTSKSTWARGVRLYGNNSAFTGKLVARRTAGSYFWLYATNDVNFGAVPGAYTADALTLDGAYLQNAASRVIDISANRGITLGSNGLLVYNGALGTINFNSIITGIGGLTLSASTGTINLNNVNDYPGTTGLMGGKTVLGMDNALPHGTGKGNIWFRCWDAAATLDLNGHVVTINGVHDQGGTYSPSSCIDNSAAGPATLIVGDGDATQTFPRTIKNTGGALSLTKIGTGTQTLSGSCTYTGATTVNGGTLTISATNSASSGMTVNNGGTLVVSGFLSNSVPLTANAGGTLQADLATNPGGVFNSASAVKLAGGTLNIKGKNSGTSATALGNLNVDPAGSTISITPNGGSGTTLTLGNTWTRQVGGTLLVDLSTAGSTVTSSPALTNGIVGGYAFVKDGTGTGFATVSGGNVVRYTGATVLDATAAASDLNSTVNYTVTNSVTLTGSSATQTVNSISIILVPNTVMVNPNNKLLVVGAGGVIASGSAWARLTWNTERMTSGTGDLVFHISGWDPDVGPIVDNGSTKVGVTKTGPNNLLMNAGNTYSGDTVINQGAIIRGSVIPNGAGKGNLLVNAGATFEMGGGSGGINGLSQSTNNPGGTVQNGWGGLQTLTLGNGDATASFSGIISGGGSGLALIKIGTGTQTLSGANTYAGGTTLSNGVLSVSSLSNIGGANAKVTFAGGTLRISGTTFNSFGSTPLTFTSAGGGLDIVDAGNSLTLTNNLAAGTVLTKTGAGTLTLTGAQAGTLNTDDASKISFGAGLGFYNLGVTSGGTLSPAGSGTTGTVAVANNLTLAGTYVADVANNGTSDTVTAGGSITLATGATLQLVNASLLNCAKRYTLMTAAGGSVAGTFTFRPSLPYNWRVSTAGGKAVLYYSVPGTMIRVL